LGGKFNHKAKEEKYNDRKAGYYQYSALLGEVLHVLCGKNQRTISIIQ